MDINPEIGNINDFCKDIFKKLVNATKSSNGLPNAGDDYDYYSSYNSFRELMTLEGRRILSLTQSIIRYHGLKGNVQKEDLALEDRYDAIIDVNDQFLERIGNFLDEAAGLKKEESPLIISSSSPKQLISGSWNKKKSSQQSTNYRLLAAKIVQRPQKKFKDIIDNSRGPFIPKIKNKLHALKPLQVCIIDAQSDDNVHSRSDVEMESFESFPHPYLFELESFKPSDTDLKQNDSLLPLGVEDTPLLFVQDGSKLSTMIDDLKKERIIAVDLEAHTYRTFQGFTCLMQISSRSMDYLIDVILLRSEMYLLNVIFTDPNIVKVLHGADSDIIWLQRDFGIYIVNLFDTGQAARVLNFPKFSLAYLLQYFCQVEADKQYQLADWRIRPLPEELIRYAREDTHYLLYVYDKLKKLLIENGNENNNLLLSVYQRSTNICLKIYEKPRFTANGYMDLYRKQKVLFNNKQLSALERMYAWRDEIARTEDESVAYVLPNHMMLQICQYLPKESHGILACCNPIPPLLRQYLPEIFKTVTESRSLPMKVDEKLPPVSKSSKPSSERIFNIFDNPHDSSWDKKERKIPNLLAEQINEFHDAVKLLSRSNFGLFSAYTPIKAQISHIETLKKVEKITNSIESPLDPYFTQSRCLKSAKSLNLKTEEAWQWKLLPNTPKEQRIIKKTNFKIVPAENMLIDTENDQAGIISLNQMNKDVPKKDMKRKVQDLCDDGIEPEKSKILKLESKTSSTNEDFKAYDYKKFDYSFFEGENHLKKKGQQKQKPKFNKFEPKMTVHSDKGHKNHSFGLKQPQTNSKWPKK